MESKEPKYHDGDKVVVIPSLSQSQRDKYIFTSDMSKQLGKTVTIKGEAYFDETYGYYYDIKESRYAWLEPLFDGLENEINAPFDESEYNNLMSF